MRVAMLGDIAAGAAMAMTIGLSVSMRGIEIET